jgi:hypothetical protein
MTEMDSEFDKLIVGEKCINLLDFSPHKFREVGGGILGFHMFRVIF